MDSTVKNKPLLTPMKAVQSECRDCAGNIECLSELCYLNKGNHGKMSYVRRIRYHCENCAIGFECEVFDCPLHPYRLGKNPARILAGRRRGASHLKEYSY